ncbi:MAG TPA: phosphate ABC transporter permease subunit PstC [Acetobacteraceae bacterium]|nr:phosphate ABC transporter permease subunit PstC [Acetobacteraceae bacterium]
MKLRPFRLTLLGLTCLIPAALGAVLLFLALFSWPAIRFNGIGFLLSETWSLGNLYADPVKQGGMLVPIGASYGILVFLVGTLATSAIALLIAVPVSLGVAMFLAEGVSPRLRGGLALIVEMLAVVPSVVYGLWGVTVLVPLVAHVLAPALSDAIGFIPFFRVTSGSGFGLFAAALVLTLMVVPIITTTVLDALTRVPREAKEAAYALGTTRFEMVRKAMLPMVRPSIVGAVILGLGRALGETMAVLMVSGGALNYLPGTINSPVSTMASFIVSQLDSAEQDPTGMAVRSLAEIALVLFIITVVVNVIARLMVRGVGKPARV